MKATIFFLTAVLWFAAASSSWAQSGRASLHGWVAFENVAYVDKQPKAKVELRPDTPSASFNNVR